MISLGPLILYLSLSLSLSLSLKHTHTYTHTQGDAGRRMISGGMRMLFATDCTMSHQAMCKSCVRLESVCECVRLECVCECVRLECGPPTAPYHTRPCARYVRI